MFKYLVGMLLNLFNPAVSILALVDRSSIVSRRARIHRGAKLINSNIGSYSYLTNGCSVVYTEVGKFCSIGHGSSIGLGHHTLNNLSTSPIFSESKNATGHSWTKVSAEYPYRKVIVGNDVWMGSRVMVMGGVVIGDGVVVAAGSIVTKDIPPYAVVAGVPAKIIRFRFDPVLIDRLLEIKWWDLPEDKLRSNLDIFNSAEISISELDSCILRNGS